MQGQWLVDYVCQGCGTRNTVDVRCEVKRRTRVPDVCCSNCQRMTGEFEILFGQRRHTVAIDCPFCGQATRVPPELLIPDEDAEGHDALGLPAEVQCERCSRVINL